MVRKGQKFVQKGETILIECSKSDTYSQFAALAAAAVDVSASSSSSLMLFHTNGTQIFDEPINVRGKTGEVWTLGDYIAKQKKAAELLRFGVACSSDVTTVQPLGPVRPLIAAFQLGYNGSMFKTFRNQRSRK